MPVVIREIVTEVVLTPQTSTSVQPGTADAADLSDDVAERIIRCATERVLEFLRREWDR